MANRTLARWIDHLVMGPQRFLFQNPRKVLGNYVKRDMTVLDIGCGKGYFSLGMASMVGSLGRVICIDRCPKVIESLRVKAARIGVARQIDARVSEAGDLSVSDLTEEADFALAFYVVHHVGDVHGLMDRVFKVLKPGGRFLIVEPKHHATPDHCAATEETARNSGFQTLDHPKLLRCWAVLFEKGRVTD